MQSSWSFFFRTWKKEEWINTERNNIQVLTIFKRKRFEKFIKLSKEREEK